MLAQSEQLAYRRGQRYPKVSWGRNSRLALPESCVLPVRWQTVGTSRWGVRLEVWELALPQHLSLTSGKQITDLLLVHL